jgi:hypothetical protein
MFRDHLKVSSMRDGFQACLIAISALASGFVPALAQTPSDELELTIGFDEPIPERPAPFIYVKGRLAGIAPGTVSIPTGPDSFPIEIGIAQLSPNPLYSFVLGPTNIGERTALVVMSSFEVGAPKGKDVWSGLFLNPNTRQAVKLEQTKPGSYSIVLPAGPFQQISKYWTIKSAELSKDDWFGTVSQANDNSSKSVYSHVGYNKGGGQILLLNESPGVAWSGAHAKAGLLQGLDLDSEQWTVVSNPSGAAIHTDTGPQGFTTSTIRIVKTGGMYIVLKKDGYRQCPLEDCQKRDTRGGVMLTCNLKKLR